MSSDICPRRPVCDFWTTVVVGILVTFLAVFLVYNNRLNEEDRTEAAIISNLAPTKTESEIRRLILIRRSPSHQLRDLVDKERSYDLAVELSKTDRSGEEVTAILLAASGKDFVTIRLEAIKSLGSSWGRINQDSVDLAIKSAVQLKTVKK